MTGENEIKSEERVEEDVERLKEWLSKQPHLPQNIDNDILRSYVYGTKSLEIAKKKLDSYFTIKGKVPQIFTKENRNPFSKKYKEEDSAIRIYFLPKATPEGYRVLVIEASEDFSKFNHDQKIMKLTMMVDIALKMWPKNQGIVAIYNLYGLSNNIITKLNPALTASALHWYQSSVPLKLKKVIVIHVKPFIEVIMTTFVKPFMKEKLYNRVILSNEGVDYVKSHLPEDILPMEYGGKEKSSKEMNDDWVKLIENRADWLLEFSQMVTDESKRPPDSKATYGVEGTFRSLKID